MAAVGMREASGAEEHGDEEERSSRHGRKAGLPPSRNTGRGLDERRDRGGAADRTGGGGDGVGQHGLVHVGDLAVRQQHVAAGAGAVQRARVSNISTMQKARDVVMKTTTRSAVPWALT